VAEISVPDVDEKEEKPAFFSTKYFDG